MVVDTSRYIVLFNFSVWDVRPCIASRYVAKSTVFMSGREHIEKLLLESASLSAKIVSACTWRGVRWTCSVNSAKSESVVVDSIIDQSIWEVTDHGRRKIANIELQIPSSFSLSRYHTCIIIISYLISFDLIFI